MSPDRPFPLELLSASVILDTLAEGALLIGQDNTVTWINTALARLLDIDRDALHGSDVNGFVIRYLASLITDERCTERIMQSLHDRIDLTSLACNIHPSTGAEHRALVSINTMQDEPFQDMRLVRLHAAPLESEPHPDAERQKVLGQVEKHAEELTTANEELKTTNEELEVANEALHARTEELHTILASLSEGVWAIDSEASTTFVNERMAEMLGYTVKEMVGKSLIQFLPEEHRGRLDREGERLRAGMSEQLEYTFIRKDGSHIDTLLVNSPLYDSKGNFTGAIAGVLDITERKQAEEALRQEKERVGSILSALDTGQSLIDPDMTIVWANQKTRDFFPELEPIGQKCYRVHEGVSEPCEVCAARKVFATGEVTSLEKYVPMRGRWYDIIAQPIKDASGQVIQALESFTDITERKHAEEALMRHTEELARLHSELKTANREANLYLDILTHDIGNTENVSNLYADLLIDSLSRNGEAIGYAEKLQRSVRKSIEILGTVAKIRRIHSGIPELQPTDLDAVIRGEVGHYSEGIVRYRGSAYPVRVDDLLSEVFSNLIDNAVKHGGSDVEITIRVEEQDGEVLITVEDTGPGIPDDEKDNIFHLYEQQKRGVGEGLGLYLVQILVERYGGKVWVEDRVPGRPEEGAAFKFTLRKA